LQPKDFPEPQPFEVGEIPPEEYEENLESIGTVKDWREQLEFLEKAKMRPYITGTVVSVWTSFLVACIVRFVITGDALPLVTPVLLSGPLSVILWFYYGRLPPGG
jgi:hypothetical protein